MKILYVYGWGSDEKDSAMMNVMKTVMESLGHELISVKCPRDYPYEGAISLEDYISKNDIKCVMGYSVGGFITLCLDVDIKKIVINPCMYPSKQLPKIEHVDPSTISEYKFLEGWLYDNSVPVLGLDDVIGIFSDKDELFSYYDLFSNIFPKSFKIKSSHNPTIESFTEEAKKKIKEFLG